MLLKLRHHFWLGSAIFFVTIGIFCMINSYELLINFKWVAVIALLVNGLTDIGTYIFFNKQENSLYGFLINGCFDCLFALVLLFFVQRDKLPFLFSTWLLITSLIRIIGALIRYPKRQVFWNWICAMGIIGFGFALFAYFNTAWALLGNGIMIGAILIFQGFCSLIRWFLCLRW